MNMGYRTLSRWNIAIDTHMTERNSIVMDIELKSSEFNEIENLTIAVETNSKIRIDIQIGIESVETEASGDGVIYAACLLIFLNVLIISEVNDLNAMAIVDKIITCILSLPVSDYSSNSCRIIYGIFIYCHIGCIK